MIMLQACFIRVEVKKRELISRTDLAIEMVRRGVPVILGECYNLNDLKKIGIDKGYYFGKCAQPSLLKNLKPLLDRGWSFGALDEEGLLPDSLESFAMNRFSNETAEIFNDFFFFGKEQKEYFDKIFGPRESFVVSGNPRTDMWRSKYYGLHNQSIQDIKKLYKNYILIPLNFGRYTTKGLQTSSSQEEIRSKKLLIEKSEFLFDNFCKLAERVANETNINVIMRPHPSDDSQLIKSLMIKHGVKSNIVECISSNDVFPWISAAKLLFHNCCTTSIEAGFSDTPVFTYAPLNTSLYQDSQVNNLFPTVNTHDEALSILTTDLNDEVKEFKPKLLDWRRLSQKYLNKTSIFIADRILQRNKFEQYQQRKKFSKLIDFERISYEFRAGISSFIGRRQRRVYLDKFPRTNINEVKNIVNHICKYRNYIEQPKVMAINSRLFCLLP